MPKPSTPSAILEVLGVFFRLGLSSFGGPSAHLGYFQRELVQRRAWLSEADYADLVALCQFLPGPASSQVGMALGLGRAGLWGALAAWAGFTLPSALVLALFGVYMRGGAQAPNLTQAGWLHGLLLVAVAVVAQAVASMARSLLTDTPRRVLMSLATALALLWPAALMPPTLLLLAGLYGFYRLCPVKGSARALPPLVSRRAALTCLGLFGALLLGLPLLRLLWPSPALALLDSFYRAGALVFGGGHVVLPLLEHETAALMPHATFLAGYGAAQAVPGPLFTLSAYLGAAAQTGLHPWVGAALALVGIFLPSFLLVVGVWPFWSAWRQHAALQGALGGINAAVVGLLLATLYQPVLTSAVHGPADVAAAVLAYAALEYLKWPAWAVLLAAAVVGQLLSAL